MLRIFFKNIAKYRIICYYILYTKNSNKSFFKKEVNINAKGEYKMGRVRISYQYVDNMYVSYWKDGKWDEGKIQDGDRISISIGATALHYGQECFERFKSVFNKRRGNTII